MIVGRDGTQEAHLYVWDTETMSWQVWDGTVEVGGAAQVDRSAFTDGSGSITPIGGVYNETNTEPTEDQAAAVRITAQRAIHVNLRDASGAELSVGGGTQYTEDAASAGAEKLTLAGAVRRDTAASSSGTDGDYSTLNTTSTGRLWTSALIDTAIPAGTAIIGKVGIDQTTPGTTNAVQANAGTNLNTSLLALETTQSSGNTLTGAVNETAPASDTASSGLNGRLQRIAQRLTTLLAVFPATLDTNSGNKSASTLRVTLATDQVQLTNKLLVTPDANSAVNIAQVAGTTTDTNSGNKSAGTQRVVIATDQPALTTAMPVSDATKKVSLTVVSLQVTASGDTTLVASGTRKIHRVEMSNSHASTAVTAGLKIASQNSGAVFGKKYLPALGGAAVMQWSNGYLAATSEAITANLSAAGQVEYTIYYE